MSRATLAFGLSLALAVGVSAGSMVSAAFERAAQPFERFAPAQELVLELHDRYDGVSVHVLDHGLSRADCLASLPEDHPRFGVYYACQPEAD